MRILVVAVVLLCAAAITGRALAQDTGSLTPEQQTAQKKAGEAAPPTDEPDPAASISDDASKFYDTYTAPPPAPVNLDVKKMEHRDNVARWGIIYLSGTAVIALALIAFFAFKNIVAGGHFVQAVGLVFLVYGTVMLTIIADTDEQLTAAVGILGAIAGYLFGSRTHDSSAPRPDQGQ